MNSLKLNITVIKVSLLTLFISLSTTVYPDARTVTHAGSAGLNTSFLTSGAVGGNSNCSVCHDGVTAIDWSNYSIIQPYVVATFLTRLNANPITEPLVFMPQGGDTNVDTTMLEDWFAQGKYQYRSPYIGTGVNGSNTWVSTNNYSKSVSFTVNENGADSTFTAYYRKGADSWSSVSSLNPGGAGETGGSGSSDSDGTSTATLTNLVCGNTYSYYLYGDNAATGTTTGATNTFSITCNTGATLSGAPANPANNATEDSASTWTPTTTPGAGTDTLTYTFSSPPTGSAPKPTINSGTGQVSWTPVEGQTSSSFTIQVSDSAADTNITDTLAVTWNVTAVNDNNPIITTAQGSIPGATEDTLFSIQLAATDVDGGDTQTWDITFEDDPGFSITTGGLLTWTPSEGTAVTGDFDVTVRVRDAVSNQDTATYTVTVTEDQEAPIISATPIADQAATEDSLFTIDLDATDTDSPDTQSWAITSPLPSPDDMAIDNSGVLTWTPTTEADLTQAVTVEVTDGDGLTDSTSFNIIVSTIVDNLPVITTTSMTGGTEAIAYSSFLAFTDADIDSDSWTWSIVSGPTVQPANGAPANTFDLDVSTGEVTWTPANNETSLDFTARLTDSRGGVFYDDQALTINVSQTNDAPVITNIQAPEGTIADQAATENTQFSIDIDASDPDAGDTQTWTIRLPASKPDDMAIDTNGVLTWTPTTDVSLTQSVTVRVTDSGNLNDEVTFNINVTPVIDNAPVITSVQGDLPTNTREDIQSFAHTLTWTDADTEGDGWTWSLSAQDDPQMAINSVTGEITWAPVEGERGDFNLTARVTDDGAFYDEIALVITVLKDNEAPIISSTPISTQNATEDIQFSIDLNKTDTDIGDTEAWAITSPISLPDDMAISNTGVLTWTPSEGIDRTQVITVQVTDEGGLTDSTSFNIDVDSVNDAPVITEVIPNVASLVEHSDFSYSVLKSDSDPQDNTPDLNSNLTFSITNVSPTPYSAGPQIANNGLITWTPGDNDARTVNPAASSQDYVIIVSVADGGEDSQAPATQDFTITVTLLDSETPTGDTVPDYEDNCPTVVNTDQANNDGDSEGDLCDPDDDNDGISDIAELYHSLNPFDDSDASGDIDGDGLDNLAEFNACTGSDINSLDTCESIAIDSVAPIITHNGDFDVAAKGYTTFIDFKATANDGNDGAVPVNADNTEKNLRPGDHVITWSAQDGVPNIANEEQYIAIHPIVTLGGSQVIAENASGDVVIHFNGDVPAADFPLQITYTLSGSSSPSDYLIDLPSPITINDASEIINGTFTLIVDALDGDATESNETLTITLNSISGGPILGQTTSHQIIIVDGQVAPTAKLIATQNGIDTTFIFGDQGLVTINANAIDGNNDVLTYDWSNSDPALSGTPAGDSFNFDPSALGLASENLPRIFKVLVSISDGIATINKQILLSYQADSLVLASSDSDGDGINDDIEGLGDSDDDGIPNYLDAYDNPPNLLFSGNLNSANNDAPKFIQAESGTAISLGEFSLANNTNTPKLNTTALNNLAASSNSNYSDSGFVHFGAIYEFIITGLSDAKTSARVVIPLENAIPPGAIYRKFNGSEWFTFVEGANDSLSSATSDENGCPEPGSENYEAGLLAFRDCIQLQLSDGGANDNDGERNGTIVDPGGLALTDDADLFEPKVVIDESDLFGTDGPDSSGFINLWFSLFLGILACASFAQLYGRRKFHKKN